MLTDSHSLMWWESIRLPWKISYLRTCSFGLFWLVVFHSTCNHILLPTMKYRSTNNTVSLPLPYDGLTQESSSALAMELHFSRINPSNNSVVFPLHEFPPYWVDSMRSNKLQPTVPATIIMDGRMDGRSPFLCPLLTLSAKTKKVGTLKVS